MNLPQLKNSATATELCLIEKIEQLVSKEIVENVFREVERSLTAEFTDRSKFGLGEINPTLARRIADALQKARTKLNTPFYL